MNPDEHASVKMLFIDYRQVRVHDLSNLPSNENLNLYYNCRNFIMVEQGINNQMERDAWLHMQWIGQQQTEPATSVVILTTINLVIQNTLLMKQSPMPTALGVLQNADCENIHLDANPVHGSLIGKNSPQALRSSVFGQYNDVMDISQFEIFLYFTLIDLHIFSS